MAGVAGCGRGFAAGGRIAAVGGSRRAGFAEGLGGRRVSRAYHGGRFAASKLIVREVVWRGQSTLES
jgi:hypothetical protein